MIVGHNPENLGWLWIGLLMSIFTEINDAINLFRLKKI